MTKIAFVGTGFVADYYMTTLVNHPKLSLAGVWDRNADRLAQFGAFHNVHMYADLVALLADAETNIIVNLTTPESHYDINRAALEAGKNVYCEKPLAMQVDEAEMLIQLAEEKNLTLCAAPANALSDAFEAVATLLGAGKIDQPRLVYAEMEDGPVFRANWQDWRSYSGAPWPGVHEFEIGCTLEHAGYGLSWLVRLFGPVVHLAAFSALTFPDKGPGTDNLEQGPDFSVGCLTFESGVVARITCGLAAARDRSLSVMGDGGTLVLRDLWDNRSAIHLTTGDEETFLQKVLSRIEVQLGRALPIRLVAGRKIVYTERVTSAHLPNYPSQIDFVRGIAVQADALAKGETPFFIGHVALHLTELALALNAGERDYKPYTHFEFTPSWNMNN